MAECSTVNESLPTDPSVANCPISGTRSKRVDLRTVKSLVRHLQFAMPATQYYFCAASGCHVVYFPSSSGAPTFSRDDILIRVGAKEPDEGATICYCFGISRRQIREEVGATGRCSAVEKIKAEVHAGRCACEVKNPSGKCCLGDVARAVLEALKRPARKATRAEILKHRVDTLCTLI